MNQLEFKGKTVEEAVQKAIDYFKIEKNQLNISIIEESSKGFLGFGAKDACIMAAPKEVKTEVTVEEIEQTVEKTSSENYEKNVQKEQKNNEKNDAEEIGIAFLAPIFKKMNVSPVVHIEETDEEIIFSLTGDDVGILIGHRGTTLNALQYLLSIAINRKLENHKRVILDCENYRKRRIETLENLANRMADKVVETGRRVSLEPMSASERRIVHLALEGRSHINVESYGEEPNRRIVIYPER